MNIAQREAFDASRSVGEREMIGVILIYFSARREAAEAERRRRLTSFTLMRPRTSASLRNRYLSRYFEYRRLIWYQLFIQILSRIGAGLPSHLGHGSLVTKSLKNHWGTPPHHWHYQIWGGRYLYLDKWIIDRKVVLCFKIFSIFIYILRTKISGLLFLYHNHLTIINMIYYHISWNLRVSIWMLNNFLYQLYSIKTGVVLKYPDVLIQNSCEDFLLRSWQLLEQRRLTGDWTDWHLTGRIMRISDETGELDTFLDVCVLRYKGLPIPTYENCLKTFHTPSDTLRFKTLQQSNVSVVKVC